jgi:hypothetical protein
MPIQTASQALGNETSGSPFGFKNRIINGSFIFWQRGTTGSASGGYCSADRWSPYATVTNVANYSATLARVQDNPTSASGYSASIAQVNTLTTTNLITLGQRIESLNLQDLSVGQSMTFSFWIKRAQSAAANATLKVYVRHPSSQDSYDYNFNHPGYDTEVAQPFTITFNDISTNWQKFSCTFKTNSGMVTKGCNVFFSLQSDSGLNINNTNEIFRIANVQLETGNQATAFDWRPYITELQLCQRYYEKSYNVDVAPGTTSTQYSCYSSSGSAGGVTTNYIDTWVSFKVMKRTTSTITVWDEENNSGKCTRINPGILATSNQNVGFGTPSMQGFQASSTTGANAGRIAFNWVSSVEL